MLGVTKGRGPGGFTELWRASVEDHVVAVAWSPDGRHVAAASVGGPITVFDAAGGGVVHRLPGHTNGTMALAWSPTSNVRFASSGQDGKVRVWEVPRDAEPKVTELDGGAAWVERVAWAHTGMLLASAAGKKLRLWDLKGQLVREYPPATSTIADIAWKPGEQTLASASYGCIALYTPDRDEARKKFEWKGSQLTIAWSPNGKYLATGDQDSTVHFWYVKTGEDLQMSGYRMKVRELSWDATSRYLATGGGDEPCVWDVSGKGPANTKPLMFEGHTGHVTALAFQRKGGLLVSGGNDGLVALWHPGAARACQAQTKFDTPVTQAAWASDDARLVVGTDGGAVALLTLG